MSSDVVLRAALHAEQRRAALAAAAAGPRSGPSMAEQFAQIQEAERQRVAAEAEAAAERERLAEAERQRLAEAERQRVSRDPSLIPRRQRSHPVPNVYLLAQMGPVGVLTHYEHTCRSDFERLFIFLNAQGTAGDGIIRWSPMYWQLTRCIQARTNETDAVYGRYMNTRYATDNDRRRHSQLRIRRDHCWKITWLATILKTLHQHILPYVEDIIRYRSITIAYREIAGVVLGGNQQPVQHIVTITATTHDGANTVYVIDSNNYRHPYCAEADVAVGLSHNWVPATAPVAPTSGVVRPLEAGRDIEIPPADIIARGPAAPAGAGKKGRKKTKSKLKKTKKRTTRRNRRG